MIFLLSALIALYIEKPSKTQHSLKNHRLGFQKKLAFFNFVKISRSYCQISASTFLWSTV